MKKMMLIVSAMMLANSVQAAGQLSPLPAKPLQAIKQTQTQIQAALKTATPEQADKLLLQYNKKMSQLINTLAKADKKFLKHEMAANLQVSSRDENKVIFKTPALKAREKQLAQYGLRYQYYGVTGHGYILINKNHYNQFFGKKISPAAQAYLNLRANQDESLFYDQEMTMPYEQVGERVIAWERYLNQFGKQNPLLKQAQCQYILHQSAFLTGGYIENRQVGYGIGITGILANAGNQPAPKQEKLKPEVRQAWANYQKKYPKSASSLLIAKMPKKPPFQAPADKILENYHKQVGLYALAPELCEKLWF